MSRRCVDRGRLWQDVRAIAEIGRQADGGNTRLAYSAEEARAHEWIIAQYRALGLPVRIDAAGNVVARREGARPAAAVLTGSHLDTVPSGGHFDGVAGSVAALEAARVIATADVRTERPLEFIVFAAEESPRFKAGHRFGSRAMAGLVGQEEAESLVDQDGITLAAAMRRLGLKPEHLPQASRRASEIDAVVELHLEQGTALAGARCPVGIVTAIAGTRRYTIDLQGRADHSGGTPMVDRKDALAGAAEIVLALERMARELNGTLVATATMLTVRPNAMNVVAGGATLGVDIRDVDAKAIEVVGNALRATVEEVTGRRGLEGQMVCIRDTPPAPLSSRIREAAREAAGRAGVQVVEVASHTGHDVLSFKDLSDAGMIFVRNNSGRSHSPLETMAPQDFCDATQVLLETVLNLAGEMDV